MLFSSLRAIAFRAFQKETSRYMAIALFALSLTFPTARLSLPFSNMTNKGSNGSWGYMPIDKKYNNIPTVDGEKGWGWHASSVRVEPTLHGHTVSMTISEKADCTAVERCQADRKGQVLVQCREPKTGQQKVQLSSKTKHFAHLGMINLCISIIK